jgi:hypothetical protein
MENNQVHRRNDFPSWSWLGWQYNDEIPLQPIILCDLEDRAYSDGTYRLYGGRTKVDEHSAKTSAEFLGGSLLNLTEAHRSSITLDMALPREARIMPHLVVRGVILPLIFEPNEAGSWVRVGDQSRPFYRRTFLFCPRFRMWLYRPDAEEQDAFRRNQVRALVLGLFGAVIRILILRKTGNGWTRIGIG